MAKNVLPTNFQDDILNANMNGRRRYKLIQNADGTVSLEDASAYDQVGSNFGAGQINATNTAVNASADAGKIIDNTDDIMANTQKGMMAGALALKEVNSNLGGLKFGIDASGNYGYYKAGADSVTPFKQLPMDKYLVNGGMDTSRNSFSKTVTLPKGNYLVALAMGSLNTGSHPTSSHGILLSNGNYTDGSSSVYYLQLTNTTTVTFHYPCGWDYTGWSYNILS